MTRSILILCTSATGPLGDTGPTGAWAEEIAAPFYEWRSAGFKVKITSVAGGEVPWDEASTRGEFLTSAAEGFLRDEKLAALWRATPSAKEVLAAGVEQYDALYLPGGHGAMLDFVDSDEVKALVEAFWSSGRVVAAVCHGPAGLVNAVDAEGAPIVKGRRATGFTNSEEKAVGKDEAVPFMLETRLVELGALVQVRDDWQPHVVIDGQLITGQNPQSSFALAQAVAGALAPHAQVCDAQGDSYKAAD